MTKQRWSEPRNLVLMFDLETTGLGLDPVILEAAWSLWEPVSDTVLVEGEIVPHRSLDSIRPLMVPEVYKMHKESGLLDLISSAQSESIESDNDIGIRILATIEDEVRVNGGERLYLGGCGIAAFDHPIVKGRMPALASRLHYRPIDASIARTVLEMSGVEFPEDQYPFVEFQHRAAADVHQALELMRWIAAHVGNVSAPLVGVQR